jgi:hypothetical protein
MLSYDPEKNPELPNDVVEFAARNGLQIVHVLLTPPGCPVDESGPHFYVVGRTVPRIGELIVTQNKIPCRVRDVQHYVVSGKPHGGSNLFMFSTLIIGERVEDDMLEDEPEE